MQRFTSLTLLSLQAPSFRIPLIDFGKFLNASTDVEKRQTAQEVVNGFKEVGFIYLSKHGIPDSTVANAFQKVSLVLSHSFRPEIVDICANGKSGEFFSLPKDLKVHSLRPTSELFLMAVYSIGNPRLGRSSFESWLRSDRPRACHTVR